MQVVKCCYLTLKKSRKNVETDVRRDRSILLIPNPWRLGDKTEPLLFLLRLPSQSIYVTKQNVLSLAKSQSCKVHGWLTLLAIVINNDIGSGVWTLESIVFLSQSLRAVSPFNRLLGFLPPLMGVPCSHQVIILSIIQQEVHLWKHISLSIFWNKLLWTAHPPSASLSLSLSLHLTPFSAKRAL